MQLSGQQFIGYRRSNDHPTTFQALNPATGQPLPGLFYAASAREADEAMQLAAKAFEGYKNAPGKFKAAFLIAIADEILALGDVLIQRAMAETALPQARLEGERGRTMSQLRLFAQYLEEGSWVEARIDPALPERQPLPRPDLRNMLMPLGPVVVFGASNFPLAFSTAGGDTASALAAGCPVVVKAHPAHPGTSALVAGAIVAAAQKTGLPEGVFSMLFDEGYETGSALTKHPLARAVAFTGSQKGGMALYQLAQQRPDPIPVFAEMGSVNPVILFPKAVQTRATSLATQLAASITLGVGQFCTNPGLILAVETPELDGLLQQLGAAIEAAASGVMLSAGIRENFSVSAAEMLQQQGVEMVGKSQNEATEHQAVPVIGKVIATRFLKNPRLHEEVFGPFSLVVACVDETELAQVIQALPGQLTGTLMAELSEIESYAGIVQLLQNKVGRLIFNGVPTGVEVGHAMQHGGPFPATTDPRFTSVGTAAIRRFVRPVAYQDFPDALLPDALKRENPLNIWRLVNGEWRKS
ncbi:MAG: aldehyde dehydrogenase (NADP(+)) [Saprospiraceae bacterium]|nr:aldehyde dehydrogenase (NADP(+)) [Saprospiraceae bacterium]MDZ4703935.1 aldehyde dehydrogenase (NADP(+)) [Saprospiraceae bacterium]